MNAPPPHQRLPGDFAGQALAARPESWTYELEPAARTELARLADHIARGETDEVIASAVRAAGAEATRRTIDALDAGPGFILLRGVPTDGRSRATLATLYTMIGRALGTPRAQNLEGELITDIRDTGEDPRDPDVRLYRTRAEQDFHTDGADVIGLLCLQPSRTGGASRIVSSVRVYQAVRAARPDLAPLLFQPWFFRIPGARARGLPEALPRPIATYDGTKLETFFIGWYIRNAQGLAGVPPLDDAHRELLALYETTANDPSLYLDMDFRPGDVQWLRNAFVLHKRTAYEDHAQPERKRHLLRLWLDLERLADGMPRFPDGGGVPR
jgi:Taurine catabolism dioxygenase TauD, TfdA family